MPGTCDSFDDETSSCLITEDLCFVLGASPTVALWTVSKPLLGEVRCLLIVAP